MEAEGPQRQKAAEKAYRLLALRAHSERELRAKLLAGRFPEGVVAEVLERCREQGYLDDARYARERARDLAVNRLAGDRLIAADLYRKGIDEALARAAIAAVREEFGEAAAVERLLEKRTKGRGAGGRDIREKARLARLLMGKGFPAALVAGKLWQTEEEGFHGDDGE